MKPIYVLAIAVLLAVATSIWLVQQPDKNVSQTQLLFSDLQHFANDLQSVEVKNAQGVVLSAKKSNDNWLATVAPQLPDYPISQDNLANLVTTLLQVKLVEPKTSKATNYSRLGLQDIKIGDSLASLVTLKTKGQSWSVLVGNTVSFADGSYVRKPNSDQSWRTDKSIQLPLDKFSWLKQPILPFELQDIVAISRVDKANWRMAKVQGGEFKLNPMAADRSLAYSGVLDAMANSVVNLNFEKLFVSQEIVPASLNILTELEIELAQGQIIKLVISELDGKHLVSFPAALPREYSTEFSTEFSTEYWRNWHYQISTFSAQQLMKSAEDFLAEKTQSIQDQDAGSAASIEEGESPG